MPAKKAALESEPVRSYTKAEACKILQVAPTADEELITTAYWHLARKERIVAHHDPGARHRLDNLNRAYRALNPAGGDPPLGPELRAVPEEAAFSDRFFTGLRRTIEETIARWPGRTAEMAMLAVVTVILGYLALTSGASPMWTVLAAGCGALAIWAPWRRI
jgi:hypothetical protein